MLKFVINLDLFFRGEDRYTQFQKATKAGFRFVEIWSPLDIHPDKLIKVKSEAGMNLLQFGMDEGDELAGDCGILSIPLKKERFRSSAINEIKLAKLLDVKQMNCICGIIDNIYTMEEQLACMRENLNWLHPLLERNEVNVNIEFISSSENLNYLFSHSQDLYSFLDDINLPRIGVQFDFFHCKMMGDDLINIFKKNLQLIRHVQIADVPGRHQPGTGEINFLHIFEEIEKSGYDKYISLEYIPLGSLEESLSWLPKNCRIECKTSDLNL